ncbi:uncharacterized protein ACBT57_026170 isoform 2-T2 [Dama dama]
MPISGLRQPQRPCCCGAPTFPPSTSRRVPAKCSGFPSIRGSEVESPLSSLQRGNYFLFRVLSWLGYNLCCTFRGQDQSTVFGAKGERREWTAAPAVRKNGRRAGFPGSRNHSSKLVLRRAWFVKRIQLRNSQMEEVSLYISVLKEINPGYSLEVASIL